MDLEGYYITPKVGVSASEKTGVTNFTNNNGNNHLLSDKNLGDSIIIGVSAGKYIKDNIRLELEVLKRDDYKYKVFRLSNPTFKTHADISSTALFINGFYEFEPLSILNKPLVPYLGGGIGGSQNKMGTVYAPGSNHRTSKTIEELAYKLSAGTLFSIKKIFL